MHLNFASDNWAGCAPEVLAAIERAGRDTTPAYGNDDYTRRARAALAAVFATDCTSHFVTTGSAANGLALATACPPYGAILCYEASHIQIDECGLPEFYSGGAKLVPLPGVDGKLTPAIVARALAQMPERSPHLAPPAAISITQGSECGTVYTPDEVAALAALAHRAGLKLHMDGARFANAVAATGASPAELSWRAGVDVLSFGGTKNGCLAAEAVVFFDAALVRDFEYRRKRGGHLWSKMRFLGAQFEAYLADDLWLRLAANANAMAQRLARGFAEFESVHLSYPTQINEVFATFPDGVAERLQASGAHFYPWVTPGDPADGRMQRFVTSFATGSEEVDRLLQLLRTELAASGRGPRT
jgi:threonine aldolase